MNELQLVLSVDDAKKLLPKVHPAAEIFPWMDDEALMALASDIAKNGQREPITLRGGEILDGRNRFVACKMAGKEPVTVMRIATESDTAFVVSKNLQRRHLTPPQRAALAVELEALFKSEAEERRRAGEGGGDRGRSLDKAAALAGAGKAGARSAKKIQTEAPEVHALMRQGKIDIEQAKRLAEMPENARCLEIRKIHDGKPFAPTLFKEEKEEEKPKAKKKEERTEEWKAGERETLKWVADLLGCKADRKGIEKKIAELKGVEG